MKLSRIGVAVLAVVVSASASWATETKPQTFATFADPAKTADTPLFWLSYDQSGDISSVVGKWEGEGLTLQMYDNMAYTNATFVMGTLDEGDFVEGPIAVTAGKLGAGVLIFKDSVGSEIARMTWTDGCGSINDFGLGASNRKLTVSGARVQIENKTRMDTYSEESFAFAFTNFVDIDNSLASATASFTSSANIVTPEPATMCLLALGSFFCFGRRTRG